MASRYESVAAMVSPSLLTSSSTPVRIGRASSRDAALATWATPSASSPAFTFTRIPPGSWRAGKSSAGRHRMFPS